MRISGITIPENKRIEIGLTAVYGIGRPLAHKILTEAGIGFETKSKDISEEHENRIRKIIEGKIKPGDMISADYKGMEVEISIEKPN